MKNFTNRVFLEAHIFTIYHFLVLDWNHPRSNANPHHTHEKIIFTIFTTAGFIYTSMIKIIVIIAEIDNSNPIEKSIEATI